MRFFVFWRTSNGAPEWRYVPEYETPEEGWRYKGYVDTRAGTSCAKIHDLPLNY